MIKEDTAKSFFKEVDLQIVLNNSKHHTSDISKTQLIVRRGQAFQVSFELWEPIDTAIHPLLFTAETGEKPFEDRGTLSHFGIPESAVKRSPAAKAVWKAENYQSFILFVGTRILSITPPADCPIGKYTLRVKHRDEEKTINLVVLFNPWCSDDWVYLPNVLERKEYVLNEHGVLFIGSWRSIGRIPWNYAQFEDGMVDICMKLLDLNPKHKKDPADDVSARCNPIYVSRVISRMVNSNDDKGVLQGRWADTFPEGVSPTQWIGSRNILTKWMENNFQPVKYGQCWVFAGVMCSVMRLLGIPCRVVTNFASAHDTNADLIIEEFNDKFGPMGGSGSIWNFHVWTEGWMTRPDVSEDGKYDGWQVLDATPQELSEGAFCCGPASVKAVHSGDIDQKYDLPFVFAEVNADKVVWLVEDGMKIKYWADTKIVGKRISTKDLYHNGRKDLTDTYKFKEGSAEERTVFRRALEKLKEPGVYANELLNQPVVTNVCVQIEEETLDKPGPLNILYMKLDEVSKPMNGQDVNLTLRMRSENKVPKPVTIKIDVHALTYIGAITGNVQKDVKEETVQPGEELSVQIVIPYSVYFEHMQHSDSMKVSVVVKDKQNPDVSFLTVDDIVLADPPCTIMMIFDTVRLGDVARATFIFENPINETLKDCTLSLSGSGLLPDSQHNLPDLLPNQAINTTICFNPYKTGQRTLMAAFHSSVFRDIKVFCTCTVK